MSRKQENWNSAYQQRTEIYDIFSRAEDKENKVFKKLKSLFSFKDKTVLEIGCGSCKYTKEAASESKKYYALEISKPLIQIAKQKCKNVKKIKFINCSAEKIPLKDKSIDVVFASWALSAITPISVREKALKEIHRVLKNNGDIWLIENHYTGEFNKVRGRTKKFGFKDSTLFSFVKKYKFNIVSVVKTQFIFTSIKEAKRTLGFIFKEPALNYLKKRNKRKIRHNVAILHKTNFS